MSREDIINSISKDSRYEDYCRYVCNGRDVWKDLYQYTMLYIFELPEEKLLKVNEGSIEWYVKRIMYVNANYKNTPFHKEYEGRLSVTDVNINPNTPDEAPDEAELVTWKEQLRLNIESTLKEEARVNKGYSEVGLFKLWMNNGEGIRELARKVDIAYPTVRYQIADIIKKINENTSNNK